MLCAQTIPYMPPELLFEQRLTPLVDVYSFGIIMWELFTGEVRWPAAAPIIVRCCFV